MNKQLKQICSAGGLALLIYAIAAPGSAYAQQSQSVEELEKLLDQQKQALTEVEANREATETQAQQARDLLAEQKERKAKLEAQFETLCKERDELEQGSLEDCLSSLKN
ncbi:MAG: hypothetical protein KTR32_39645 [Granulosicoccus sp.]|nr:hypothetical protein [Granulosicoccus sp.]